MQKILKPAIAILCTGIITLVLSSAKKVERTLKPNVKPKIQVAILLDVSSSMDGLIEQAKAQLWNMVNTMGRAKCNEVSPEIEISLYEYGRTNNDVKKGYVKQINGFINNLDSLSENLFTLKTNGGEDYLKVTTMAQWDSCLNSVTSQFESDSVINFETGAFTGTSR